MAYNTVLTVVDNLHRKGRLQRECDGRVWRYWPATTGADCGVVMRDVMVESDALASSLVSFVRQFSPGESVAVPDVLEAYERDGGPA